LIHFYKRIMTNLNNNLNLLALDPDQLLVSHSVVEVERVAHRLQREVDSKREELRVMVGERYRDLIEAADTIQKMKSSSLAVIDSVSDMQSTSINLQKHSLTYTVPKYTESGPTGINLPYLSVAASIKLLMAVPERIWAAVEDQQLTQGAELYLLAQHVHTGLQGDQGGGLTPERIKQWFPVVSRQYATINNFYAGIINSAKEQLMNIDLQKELAVDALTAILLLKGINAEELLDEFLELRRECLKQSCIKGRAESARSSICGYIRGVVCTVDIVSSLFVENSQLEEFVREASSPHAPRSIHLIGKVCLAGMVRYLAEPVLHYKPRLSKPYSTITNQKLVSKMMCWIEVSQVEGEQECSRLLQDISTLQGVAGVKQAVWILLQEFQPYKKWNSSVQVLCGREFELWSSFYQETVKRRQEELIDKDIREQIGQLNANFIDKCSDCKTELNLGSYIWGEAGSDLSSLWGRGGDGEPGLLLKCRGWSPAVKSLCADFDKNLANLWNDINNINKADSTELGPFDRYSDAGAILNHFRSTLTTNLRSVTEKLVSEVEEMNESCATLFLARTLQSFPVLVKTLHTSLPSKDADEGIQCFLSSSSSQVFRRWSENRVSDFKADLNKLKLEDVFSILPTWDNVNIQESGESGDVASIIKIPCIPSTQFSGALNNLASNLQSAHASAIPHAVLLEVSRQVLQIVVQQFSAMLDEKMAQNVALQMAFNVRFAEIILLSREYKEQLESPLADLMERIESNIDPFDLSVFTGHLESRVKRCAARELTSLCPIIPQDRIQMISSFKPAGSNQDASNLLTLNPIPPTRFQLLPLAVSTSSAVKTPRTPRRDARPTVSLDVKKSASARRRSRSPVAAAAASFFGSMGSSWFGAGS